MLALFGSGSAQQALDKDKLDRFLDRLAEKNKAMGSMTLARDGNVLYSHSFGYRYVNGTDKKPADAETKCPRSEADLASRFEATAQDKFKIDPGVFFEFDAEKGQMTITRPGGTRVFTKEK